MSIEFLSQVKRDHAEHYVPGHDYLHACIVSGYVHKIAENVYTRDLCKWAALLHNYDRMGMEDQVPDRLKHVDITPSERAVVCRAVKEHSKLNSAEDDVVTATLKDADRLANIGASFLIRLGQFRADIPWINYGYGYGFAPESTYAKPTSCMEVVRYALEWESMLRLPKAKLLSRPRFALMRMCLVDMEQQMEEAGFCLETLDGTVSE